MIKLSSYHSNNEVSRHCTAADEVDPEMAKSKVLKYKRSFARLNGAAGEILVRHEFQGDN